MIIIFGALKIELGSIIHSAVIDKAFKKNGIVFYSGTIDRRDVLIVLTGMGKDNASKAARIACNFPEVKKTREVKALITGFCGATDKKLKAGDLVIYNKVINITKGIEAQSNMNSGLKNDFILPSAEIVSEKNKISNAVCGCTGKVISAPEEKKYINKRYNADVIDMETYWITGELENNGLSLNSIYCIRTVSDDASSRLPSYFSADNIFQTLLKFFKSLVISVFSRDEFRANINALKNIRIAKSRLNETILRFIQE